MKNWKTTVAGVIAIVIALAHAAQALINGQPIDLATVIAAVVSGAGLIAAKDHNVTGS